MSRKNVRMSDDHVLKKCKEHVSFDAMTIEPSHAGGQGELIDRESLSQLQTLLGDLPAKDTLLVELSYMRELPPEEVAQLLHISVGAFYTRKNRIIEKLKKMAQDNNDM